MTDLAAIIEEGERLCREARRLAGWNPETDRGPNPAVLRDVFLRKHGPLFLRLARAGMAWCEASREWTEENECGEECSDSVEPCPACSRMAEADARFNAAIAGMYAAFDAAREGR